MRAKKEKIGATKTDLQEICFPVEYRINPRQTNRRYSRIVTGIINGVEWDLNYCSPNYQLIPNADIFPKIEDLLNSKGIKFSASYRHVNNVHFYVDYVIEDPRFAYLMKGSNDVIKFKWHQQKSYDGTIDLEGFGGFYRLVCTNGLMMPVAELKQFNLHIGGKHTKSVLKQLELFDNMLKDLVANFPVMKSAIASKYELLGGRMVAKLKDRVEEVLNAVNITAVDNSKFNTVNDIVTRIKAEAKNPTLGYNGKVNDWLVYNGINQYINDDTRNISSPVMRNKVDSKVLEYMLENA
jgi:hypothetical protein